MGGTGRGSQVALGFTGGKDPMGPFIHSFIYSTSSLSTGNHHLPLSPGCDSHMGLITHNIKGLLG